MQEGDLYPTGRFTPTFDALLTTNSMDKARDALALVDLNPTPILHAVSAEGIGAGAAAEADDTGADANVSAAAGDAQAASADDEHASLSTRRARLGL